MTHAFSSAYGETSGGHTHKLLASDELLGSMYCISLLLYWVSYVNSDCISGCCIKVLMTFTDHVMSGRGIMFFIMSSQIMAVASQSVISDVVSHLLVCIAYK